MNRKNVFQIMILLLGIGCIPSFADAVKAGVAKAIITNTDPMVMVNGRISTGTLQDLYTRVLVLNDGAGRMVFVANDLNCLDVATPLLRQRLSEEMDIPPERLVILATHNHNAPIQIVPDNFAYGRHLAEIIFNAIQEAILNERGPVRLLLGSGEADMVTAMGADVKDREVQVLKVMEADRPMAILFSQATHPLQASHDQVEPGHPGYAVLEVEQRFAGTMAIYAASAGGNQFAVTPRELRTLPRNSRKEGTDAALERKELAARTLGKRLAETVESIVAQEMVEVTGPLSSKMSVLSLPLGAPISHEEALKLSEKFPKEVGLVPYPHKNRDTNWVRMLLRYYEKGLPFPRRTTELVCTDDTYLIHKNDAELIERHTDGIHPVYPCVYEEVIAARIGPMVLLAMQGEVCAPIGMRIKEEVRKKHPLLLFAYFGEHNLYIPTRAIVEKNLYQAQVIQIQYASPVPWSLDVEDEMTARVLECIDKTMQE